MKQVTSILKMFSLALLIVGGTACTGNFDDINRKDYEVDKNELGRENYNLGATLRGLQGLVVPTKEHLYQFIEALAAGPYAGYFGAINPWTTKFETYNPSVDWQDKTFSDIFTETYPLYRDLLENARPDVGLLANVAGFGKFGRYDQIPLADSLKMIDLNCKALVAMTELTLPYMKRGAKLLDEQGGISLAVSYDSQKDVYTQMLKELDEANAVLKDNLTLDTEAFRKFDDVYYGDISKWYKYANSLKLRMAIRMSYVDPTTARQVAETAVTAGVITSNADNAWLTVEENRASMIFNGWSDHRVGADIICYMNGYNDPRRPKMFTTVKLENKVGGQTVQVDGYAGVRIGINVANKDKVKDRYCKPVIATESPYLWMNAAEVTFLRAEGALRGWSMGGDAKTLYEQAIALSFDQYGLTGADTYAANATDKPQAYKDPMKTYSVAAPASNITIAWQDGDDKFEANLERIITQKWIAMFPCTVEAWSEYRRTDYPKLLPVEVNNSSGVINDEVAKIRRLWYPPREYSNNPYITEAVNMLGGEDNGATPLWWDKKPRNP